jgi:hypothetical protein
LQAIHFTEISTPAARAVDKIIRTSSLVGLHIPEVAQAVQNILSTQLDIVDKVCVVEGYTFLVARSIDKHDLPQHVSEIFSAFGLLDLGSLEAEMALEVLKVVYAVGKTLYTMSPGKLSSGVWMDGVGCQMAEWVRGVVATFSGRFPEDFEVMEVVSSWTRLNAGHHEYNPVFSC